MIIIPQKLLQNKRASALYRTEAVKIIFFNSPGKPVKIKNAKEDNIWPIYCW
jgi:hypothetical protein